MIIRQHNKLKSMFSYDSMEDKIQKKFNVSATSASLYVRNVAQLKKKGLSEADMKNPKKLLDAIEDKQLATQRTYVMSVMRVLAADGKASKNDIDKLGKLYVQLTRDLDEKRGKTKREAPTVRWDKKLKLINARINDADTEKRLAQLLQDKLVLLLHSDMAPRRAMDWYDMELVPDKTDAIVEDDDMKANYYNMRAFVFKKFKTKKTQGVQVVKPSPKVKKTIQQMLTARDDDPGEYLFQNRSGNKFTNPAWNKMLKRVSGLTTNELRKAYANAHVDTEAVRKAMEVAKKMGHSLDTAEKDYYDNEGEEEKNERE